MFTACVTVSLCPKFMSTKIMQQEASYHRFLLFCFNQEVMYYVYEGCNHHGI